MKTTYAGAEGILIQMEGKLTILNTKSSRLSWRLVNSFPLQLFSKCMSRYEADFTVSQVLRGRCDVSNPRK